MCFQKKTLQILENAGALKRMPAAQREILKAQVKDAEESYKADKDFAMELQNVKREVSEIKNQMITKDDLQNFKNELVPEIRKAAQLDLVKKTFNYKSILIFLGVFFFLTILLSFGIRGLEIIAPVIEKTLG